MMCDMTRSRLDLTRTQILAFRRLVGALDRILDDLFAALLISAFDARAEPLHDIDGALVAAGLRGIGGCRRRRRGACRG